MAKNYTKAKIILAVSNRSVVPIKFTSMAFVKCLTLLLIEIVQMQNLVKSAKNTYIFEETHTTEGSVRFRHKCSFILELSKWMKILSCHGMRQPN